MATKNAIDSNKPIEVAKGGTGAATLTDHGVLVGSGTAAISTLVVGATGTLLVGSAGGDPAFATSVSEIGDFTFSSSTAGVTRTLTVENTDNTNVASRALMEISSGGASGGDPLLDFDINILADRYINIDNSDFDKLNVAGLFVTTAGEITKPYTPAFLAQKADGEHAPDVTGDGTIYSYVCGTEIFDQSADYNTGTGQFTAPITGRYFFVANVRLSGVAAASAEQAAVYINTSNRRYRTGENRGTHLGDFEMNCVTMADMDQGDVAYPQVSASGGTKTVAVFGFTDPVITSFAGYLAC